MQKKDIYIKIRKCFPDKSMEELTKIFEKAIVISKNHINDSNLKNYENNYDFSEISERFLLNTIIPDMKNKMYGSIKTEVKAKIKFKKVKEAEEKSEEKVNDNMQIIEQTIFDVFPKFEKEDLIKIIMSLPDRCSYGIYSVFGKDLDNKVQLDKISNKDYEDAVGMIKETEINYDKSIQELFPDFNIEDYSEAELEFLRVVHGEKLNKTLPLFTLNYNELQNYDEVIKKATSKKISANNLKNLIAYSLLPDYVKIDLERAYNNLSSEDIMELSDVSYSKEDFKKSITLKFRQEIDLEKLIIDNYLKTSEEKTISNITYDDLSKNSHYKNYFFDMFYLDFNNILTGNELKIIISSVVDSLEAKNINITADYSYDVECAIVYYLRQKYFNSNDNSEKETIYVFLYNKYGFDPDKKPNYSIKEINDAFETAFTNLNSGKNLHIATMIELKKRHII